MVGEDEDGFLHLPEEVHHNPVPLVEEFTIASEAGEDDFGFLGEQVVDSDSVAGSDDGFQFSKEEWDELWEQLKQVLTNAGLTGDRLALQQGEESELLTQLLQELSVEADRPLRDWLIHKLYALVEEAQEGTEQRKRFKGTGASLGLVRIAEANRSFSSTLDEEMDHRLGLFKFSAPPRGTRRQRRTLPSELGNPQTREEWQAAEDRKWRTALANVLLESGVPIIQMVESTNDPMSALLRSVGKTRSSTIKSYLKRWTKLVVWLRRAYGKSWPDDVGQVLDYIELLAQSEGPSIPQAALQAFQWMEKTAGFCKEDMLFQKALVVRAFENLTVEMGGNIVARKQSPRFPFVLLAALELKGKDLGVPIMRRIHGGSLLFRSFGTLRFDDIQNMNPKKLRRMGTAIVTELIKSKTSGPGKRNRELPVAISLEASILGTDWLKSFLNDLTVTCVGARDFLLESATYDGTEGRGKMKTYEEAAADTRTIISELKVPMLKEDVWVESADPVIPLACVQAFAEHSGRSVLPSAAVFVEPDKSVRDMLGRWLAVGGSVDYTRTYRAAAARLQKQIADAVRSGRMKGDLREDDISDQLVRFLTESKGWEKRGAEDLLHRCLARWDVFYEELAVWERNRKELAATFHASASLPMSSPCASVPSIPIGPLSLPLEPEQSQGGTVGEAAGKMGQSRFLIVFTKKRKLARLHKADGGCPWTKIALNDSSLHDQVVPQMYNSRCRLCWPIKGGEEEEHSDTSSFADWKLRAILKCRAVNKCSLVAGLGSWRWRREETEIGHVIRKGKKLETPPANGSRETPATGVDMTVKCTHGFSLLTCNSEALLKQSVESVDLMG